MILYVGRIVWMRIKPQLGPVKFEPNVVAEDTRRGCYCFAMCRSGRLGGGGGGFCCCCDKMFLGELVK